MKVGVSRRALNDLAEIADYIAAEDRGAATRVRKAIEDAIDRIARYPYLGMQNARAADLRSVLVVPYPYRLHYRVRGETVWIVHIRHTARRPWPLR